MSAPDKPKRRRRSSEEVKTLILTAARDLFAERGFAGTTTREIAERAQVDETILFRNYGSKDQIFQEAVARPIELFLREYTDQWLNTPLGESDPEEILRNFVETLYDLAQEHRKLLLAATPGHLGYGAQHALGQLEHLAEETKAAYGYRYNAYVATRAAVAMVITMSIFDAPLLGARPRAGREDIIDELTALLTYGLTQRP